MFGVAVAFLVFEKKSRMWRYCEVCLRGNGLKLKSGLCQQPEQAHERGHKSTSALFTLYFVEILI